MPAITSSGAKKKTKPRSLHARGRAFAAKQSQNGGKDRLPAILPLLPAAVWEAWSDTLELISLEAGGGEGRAEFLDRSLQLPGLRWLERVCLLDLRQVKAFFTLDETDLAGRAIDYRVILDSGELVWVRHWLLRRSAAAGGRARLHGLVMAISEQKRLEWQCLRVCERERNRIGQELHDDVCQVLAGLSYMMQVLGGRLAREAPGLRHEFDELNADVIAAMERTRSMAHGLFPARLNYATLRHALREFSRQIRTRFSLEIALDLPRRLPRHTPEQIIHIYRIAQEAVGNSIRHGRSTAVRIALEISAGHAELRLEDNGTGFPAVDSRPEGIGLHVMQYRARILGGSLDLGNRQPAGAVVKLKYPLAACPAQFEPVML